MLTYAAFAIGCIAVTYATLTGCACLARSHCNPRRHGRWRFSLGLAQRKRSMDPMLELTITNEQKIPVSVTPTTATGKPAQLDGAVRVSVVSGDATVEMVDNASFKLVSGDNPGDSTFLVEGDADLDVNGVELIQDTITLHVAGARAANLGLTAGTAEPK